jgi:hypothetical protein
MTPATYPTLLMPLYRAWLAFGIRAYWSAPPSFQRIQPVSWFLVLTMLKSPTVVGALVVVGVVLEFSHDGGVDAGAAVDAHVWG